MQQWIRQAWSQRGWWQTLLFPLSLCFMAIVVCRRWAYRFGIFTIVCSKVPVIVVGNLAVGGSGKTPLVIWLVQQLRAQHLRVGVVSRGYGGRASGIIEVTSQSTVTEVGDEALLIVKATQAPMVVGRDRARAVAHLCRMHAVDVVISDDGLQHYQMDRAFELVVMNERDTTGNGWCLPAGPLREPLSRLAVVDGVIYKAKANADSLTIPAFELAPYRLRHLQSGRSASCELFKGQLVYAVSGIGDPAHFNHTLLQLGYKTEPHAFADHHPYHPEDLTSLNEYPVIMTEKDACKWQHYARDNDWVLEVEVTPNTALSELCLTLLTRLSHGKETTGNTRLSCV